MEIAWIDLALASVLLMSLLVGLWRGLTYELLSLAGWVAAYFGAPLLAPVLQGFLPEGRFGAAPEHLGTLVAGFVIILVVWGIGARLVRLLIQATPLSLIDRLLGAGFGLLRGVLVCLLAVLVFSMTSLAKSPTWQASRAVPWIQAALSDIQLVLPQGVIKVFS